MNPDSLSLSPPPLLPPSLPPSPLPSLLLSLPLSLSLRLDEAMRELSKVQKLAKTAQREAEESGRVRVAVGGALSSGGAKGRGLDVAAGDVETRLFLLEQRTESQERESSTLKVCVCVRANSCVYMIHDSCLINCFQSRQLLSIFMICWHSFHGE